MHPFARPRREDNLPTFIAHVEFRLDADRLEDGGRRLRELAQAASAVAFELKRGRLDPAPADVDEDQGWTSYGPTT
jgi:hypothetical protein